MVVFTPVEEMAHRARTKRVGVKGSYRKGRVEYLGMAMQTVVGGGTSGGRGGSVNDDERSVLDDEYRVISS